MLWDVDIRQHLRHPEQFGNTSRYIFTLPGRVLSSPFICSRCGWVKAIYLPYSAMKRMKQGEKSRRESPPWVKRKKKSPSLKNRTIQSRKQRKFGSLLVSTLLDVFSLSFSPLPLCCRITLIMQALNAFSREFKTVLSQTLFREPYVDFHWSAAS